MVSSSIGGPQRWAVFSLLPFRREDMRAQSFGERDVRQQGKGRQGQPVSCGIQGMRAAMGGELRSDTRRKTLSFQSQLRCRSPTVHEALLRTTQVSGAQSDVDFCCRERYSPRFPRTRVPPDPMHGARVFGVRALLRGGPPLAEPAHTGQPGAALLDSAYDLHTI